jgi:drug/metabolite transporter (DMT)-like permease
LLPLSLAVVLYFTQPISAILVARVFNGEVLNTMQIISVAAAMVGVLLLTNPSIIEGGDLGKELDFVDYPYYYWGVIAALSGSFCSGFAYLMMRRMGTNIHALHGPLYFGSVNVFTVFMIAMVIGDSIKEPFSLYGVFLLFSLGFFGWLAQTGVSKAMQVEKAGRAAPINYLQVVICWIADVLIFGKTATWTELLATFCIVFFTFLNSVQKGFCA